MTTNTLPHTPTGRPDTTTRRVALITGSIRRDRIGHHVTAWVRAALERTGRFDIDLIDLADTTLPDDGLLEPGGGPATPVTGRVADADAFVVVTPEYNHSYPAGLKRFIDWHYSEWQFKPATLVGYGAGGGWAAIEHLRGVFAELNVVTTRRAVALPAPWNDLERDAFEPASGERPLDSALTELGWWADVLADARAHRPFQA